MKKFSSLNNSMIIKYLLVGLMNTGLTAIVIFTLMHAGFNLYSSNAIGYIAGITLSFILNSLFTFNSTPNARKFIKFIITCTIAYIFNLAAIKLTIMISVKHDIAAQIMGMIVYTTTGFILNKFWVMK
ncbi:GtrA family protein [Pantoea ananatis]|uniref:GtrA family protein n=2 Tax=Pantoea ananas TaxID=553 RepID=UPI001B30C899